MKKIHLEEINSTNTFLLDALKQGEDYKEGSVIYTLRQTAGRGQIGNSWESENDKNIAFSVLLKPAFLPIKEQFLISEITCIAIVETVSSCLEQSGKPASTCSIKWPNDIYIGDDKVCGILIENSLQGSAIKHCVIGIGININQEKWIGNAPNPTSIKICSGKEFDPTEILDDVVERISRYYELLKTGRKEEIHSKYLSLLYRKDGFYPYKDAETGENFEARILNVEPTGFIILEDSANNKKRFMFKDVKFVLPCGITKE